MEAQVDSKWLTLVSKRGLASSYPTAYGPAGGNSNLIEDWSNNASETVCVRVGHEHGIFFTDASIWSMSPDWRVHPSCAVTVDAHKLESHSYSSIPAAFALW